MSFFSNLTSNQPVVPSPGESLSSGLPVLPIAGTLTPDEQELREQGAAFATSSESGLAKLSALTELSRESASAASLRAMGVFASNLGTKIAEGASDIASRFTGGLSTFSSLGAKFPSMSSMTGGSGSLGVVTAAALSGTNIPGLVSSVNSPIASAAATNRALGIGGEAEQDRSHLVTLENPLASGPNQDNIIEFLVMPEIVENRSISYEAVAPPQFPGAFQKYKGTESVQWQVNATFIARTTDEATLNLKYINMLRGWTMPFYGDHIQFSDRFKNRLGAPPPVLRFRGLRKSMIGEVPVVITSLSWNWPKDVDYLPATSPDGTQSNIPFPAVLQVSIQLVESFSTDQFNQFDLEEYLKGNMVGAYRKPIRSTNSSWGREGRGSVPQQQEAQTVPITSWGREVRGATPVVQESSSWGREVRSVIPVPPVQPAISELKTAPKIVSGGGGDFGGGGASGDW